MGRTTGGASKDSRPPKEGEQLNSRVRSRERKRRPSSPRRGGNRAKTEGETPAGRQESENNASEAQRKTEAEDDPKRR